jgi:adenylate cyclase
VVAQELMTIEPSFRVSTFVSWYPLQRAEDLTRLEAGLLTAGLPN